MLLPLFMEFQIYINEALNGDERVGKKERERVERAMRALKKFCEAHNAWQLAQTPSAKQREATKALFQAYESRMSDSEFMARFCARQQVESTDFLEEFCKQDRPK